MAGRLLLTVFRDGTFFVAAFLPDAFLLAGFFLLEGRFLLVFFLRGAAFFLAERLFLLAFAAPVFLVPDRLVVVFFFDERAFLALVFLADVRRADVVLAPFLATVFLRDVFRTVLFAPLVFFLAAALRLGICLASKLDLENARLYMCRGLAEAFCGMAVEGVGDQAAESARPGMRCSTTTVV